MKKLNLYLKTFCELELTWLGEPNHWLEARDGHFLQTMIIFTEGFVTISKNRDQFDLSDAHFAMLKKLCERVENFHIDNDLPHSAMQCRSLVNHSEWKSIQQEARDIRDKIYSTLRWI